MGYSEREVAHMYLGKWTALFRHFKWYHNLKVKRGLFEEHKSESWLDL